MTFKTKISLLLIFGITLGFVVLGFYFNVVKAGSPSSGLPPYEPIEDIPIVGKQSELTAYLKAIFQFGIATIAIVSVVAIMVGGYLYIFSGGSKGVERAKSIIVNALLGLGLALVSWIIIYTINPDLIELKGIRSTKIDIKGGGGATENANENIYAFCDVLESKWKYTSLPVGSPATLQFFLSAPCKDKITSGPIVDVFIEQKQGKASAALGKPPYKTNFTIEREQLVEDQNDKRYLNYKWEIPNTFSEDDRVSFTAIGVDAKASGSKSIVNKPSVNELLILPSLGASQCDIKSVAWLLDASGSIVQEEDIKREKKLKALLNVVVDENCEVVDPNTGKEKFILKVELLNRKQALDGILTYQKTGFIKKQDINGVSNSLWVEEKNPSGGWYYAEVTIVYATPPYAAYTKPKKTNSYIAVPF